MPGWVQLFSVPTLTALDISDCDIQTLRSEEEDFDEFDGQFELGVLKELRNLPHLQSLNLSNNPCRILGQSLLLPAQSCLTEFRALNLINTNFFLDLMGGGDYVHTLPIFSTGITSLKLSQPTREQWVSRCPELNLDRPVSAWRVVASSLKRVC